MPRSKDNIRTLILAALATPLILAASSPASAQICCKAPPTTAPPAVSSSGAAKPAPKPKPAARVTTAPAAQPSAASAAAASDAAAKPAATQRPAANIAAYMREATVALQRTAADLRSAGAPVPHDDEDLRVARARQVGGYDSGLLQTLAQPLASIKFPPEANRVAQVVFSKRRGGLAGALGQTVQYQTWLLSQFVLPVPADALRREPTSAQALLRAFVDLAIARDEPFRINVRGPADRVSLVAVDLRRLLTDAGATADVSVSPADAVLIERIDLAGSVRELGKSASAPAQVGTAASTTAPVSNSPIREHTP